MITSSANARVKRVRALQTRRKTRFKERAFVAEGHRLASEAVAAGAPVELVLYVEGAEQRAPELLPALAELGAEIFPVSEQVMASCTSTESPPGLLLVLPFLDLPIPDHPTLVLIVDRVADPGNLGALLRTARAAGVEAVLLTRGSADPYNPKVVRAGAGAHFHLPLRMTTTAGIPDLLPDVRYWLADPSNGTPYVQVNWHEPTALIMSSEAHGPQPALRALTKEHVHIPMKGKTESLNVAAAAAVLLFEIVRQRGAQ